MPNTFNDYIFAKFSKVKFQSILLPNILIWSLLGPFRKNKKKKEKRKIHVQTTTTWPTHEDPTNLTWPSHSRTVQCLIFLYLITVILRGSPVILCIFSDGFSRKKGTQNTLVLFIYFKKTWKWQLTLVSLLTWDYNYKKHYLCNILSNTFLLETICITKLWIPPVNHLKLCLHDMSQPPEGKY